MQITQHSPAILLRSKPGKYNLPHHQLARVLTEVAITTFGAKIPPKLSVNSACAHSELFAKSRCFN